MTETVQLSGGHEHVVNDHSTVRFNGGTPVFLCGHDNGECRVIVCYADSVYSTEGDHKFVPGKLYPGGSDVRE